MDDFPATYALIAALEYLAAIELADDAPEPTEPDFVDGHDGYNAN